MTNAFRFGFYGRFQHGWVNAFGKNHTLRVTTGGVVQLTGKLAFLSHQLFQVLAVSFPVRNRLAGYTRFHSSLGNSHGYFGNQARVNRLRDEIVGAEGEVVYMIHLVHHVGYRLLGQVGDGTYGS